MYISISPLQSIIEGYSISPTDDASGLPTAFSTPSTPSTASTPGKRPSTIRPLTAAYHASSSQHQVNGVGCPLPFCLPVS